MAGSTVDPISCETEEMQVDAPDDENSAV